MPDKEIMLQIRQLEEQRPWDACEMLFLSTPPTPALDHANFRQALVALAESWRAEADLYDRAKLKGAQTAYIVPLRHAAQQLDLVIKGLEQPRRAPLGELQPPVAPHPFVRAEDEDDLRCVDCGQRRPAAVHREPVDPNAGYDHSPSPMALLAAGLDEPRHRFEVGPGATGSTCTAMVERDGHGDQCGRFASHPAHRLDGPTERPGLDALIAEASAAEHVIKRSLTDFPGQVGADEVTAYLRGEADDIAGSPPLQPSSVHDMTDPADDLGVFGIDERATETLPTARETLKNATVTMPPVPLLGQPGDAGAGYAHSYVPPGGMPLTFAELMTPVPAAHLPVHLSHSQIETALDCPTKYRAQRLPRQNGPALVLGVEQIPQWALIGGGAFHAAVESIERAVLAGATLPPVEQDFAEKTWRTAFDAECQKIEATSPVPRSRWRASKQGGEGETWWGINGPLMITRYLAARPVEPTASLPVPNDVNGLQDMAIELERTVDVPTPYGPLPYRAIIDHVTVRPFAGHDSAFAALVIRDYKTGDRMPEDTSQLGEYANVLRLLGVPASVKILGTFFNARKGTWTPEVDLDQAWPFEWFVHHVAGGHAARLALTTGPTPARVSSYCGGCSVRWACPVKNAGRP